MTTPKEMRMACDWHPLVNYNDEPYGHGENTKLIEWVQANALEWAAEQIKESNSPEEALMRLSIKHQELVKGKI